MEAAQWMHSPGAKRGLSERERELDANLADAPRRVWLFLRSMCWDKPYCWPTISFIAEGLGVSDRTVQRALRKLELVGVVETQQRKVSRTWNRSSMYCVTTLLDRFATGIEKVKEVFAAALKRRDSVTPVPDSSVTHKGLRPVGTRRGSRPRRDRLLAPEGPDAHGETSTRLQRW